MQGGSELHWNKDQKVGTTFSLLLHQLFLQMILYLSLIMVLEIL